MEALLPIILTFGLMWALLIRPQQRRVRQHQELVATVSAGDEIITTGGVVGTIESVVDDIVVLEVAPGVSIRLLRSAIHTRIAAEADVPDSYEADDDDLVDDDDGLVGDDMEAFEDDLLDPGPRADAAPEPEPRAAPAATTSAATEVDAEYIPPPPAAPTTNPPTTGDKA